ncbi:MAG: hypothetical protein CL685_00765 [Candidatus Magasanikbacteria bacterium]|nr:hypothetical protein [Candidatus Magasanikbacteria bacterium]
MRFAGPNAIYLQKELRQYAQMYKKEFETEPLIVHYQLQRLKEKVHSKRRKTYATGSHRARCSMYLEKPRKIQLSGNIPLGSIHKSGTITHSIQLKDKIIPASLMRYSMGTTECWKVTYWEIEKVWIEDTARGALYCCLFG